MICKDCLHYEVCGGYMPTDLDKDVWDYCAAGRSDEIPDIEERCESFKDVMRFVELPCKIGDTVYMPIGRRGKMTGYETDQCDGFHIGNNGTLLIKVKNINIEGNHGTYGVPGRTAFISEAEAIAALRKDGGTL